MEQPKKNHIGIIREQIEDLRRMETHLRCDKDEDLKAYVEVVRHRCFLAAKLPDEEKVEVFREGIDKLLRFGKLLCHYPTGFYAGLLIRAWETISFCVDQIEAAEKSIANPAPAAEYDINEVDLEAHKDDPVPGGMDFLIWNDEETGEIVLALTKDEPLRLSSKEARALARTLFRRSNETMSIPRDDSNAGSLSLLRNRPQEKKQSQELHHSSRLDDTAMLQLLPNHQAACHESQQRIQGLKVSASPEPYNLQQ